MDTIKEDVKAAEIPAHPPIKSKWNRSRKPTGLNIRERRFVKGLAAGLTPVEAMRRAGYSETTALKAGSVKARDNRIMSFIQRAMERQGITDEKLAVKLNEGLDSTKVISANIMAQDGEGMADAHGTTKDFVEVPDFATRHKYLDTALKLGNHYPTEQTGQSLNVLVGLQVKIVG